MTHTQNISLEDVPFVTELARSCPDVVVALSSPDAPEFEGIPSTAEIWTPESYKYKAVDWRNDTEPFTHRAAAFSLCRHMPKVGAAKALELDEKPVALDEQLGPTTGRHPHLRSAFIQSVAVAFLVLASVLASMIVLFPDEVASNFTAVAQLAEVAESAEPASHGEAELPQFERFLGPTKSVCNKLGAEYNWLEDRS